jgi:hypothetical protein
MGSAGALACSRRALSALALCAPLLAFAQAADVPYVPTPQNVVEAMLEIAKVGPDDFVIDLGSGDGRIVITAAKKYGARGFGVELDGALVADARREADRQGVKDRAQFLAQNLFITDIDRATVLTTYLFPRINMQLRPRIFAELKPGTRVVSHEFDFGNWKPDAHVNVPVPNKRYGPPSSDVYLWIVPANAAGRWRWQFAGGAPGVFEATIDQTFQALQSAARVDGQPLRVARATMNGPEIALVIVAQGKGGATRYELNGRIDGDAIRGKARVTGVERELEWQATRIARGTINIDASASVPALTASFQEKSK